jgi:hypothetical protein
MPITRRAAVLAPLALATPRIAQGQGQGQGQGRRGTGKGGQQGLQGMGMGTKEVDEGGMGEGQAVQCTGHKLVGWVGGSLPHNCEPSPLTRPVCACTDHSWRARHPFTPLTLPRCTTA